MFRMRSGRPANAIVHAALAIAFGFMSLFHGTVVALAKTDTTMHGDIAVQHVMQAGNHGAHMHHAGHQQKNTHSMPDAVASCGGVGCFIALESLAAPSSTASVQLIATLSPAIDRAMMAVVLDPAVPPPRLQV